MARTRDMTAGSPTKHLILFTLPIIAGNAFQQLYSLVDSFVVGQVSVDALTAVASAGWLDWLVLSLAIGLAQGFGIQVAQSFGAGDYDELHRAVGQSLILSVATVVVVEILAQVFIWPILVMMDMPDLTIRMTESYLRIIFAGLPLVMGFNLFSGFLRSVGNSVTPLIAMICAALTNMVLDVLFVMGFGWGVEGAALATISGQGLSCIICLIAVLRTPALHIRRSDLRFDGSMCARLMRLGIPISFQNLITAFRVNHAGQPEQILFTIKTIRTFDCAAAACNYKSACLAIPAQLSIKSLNEGIQTDHSLIVLAHDHALRHIEVSAVGYKVLLAHLCGQAQSFGGNSDCAVFSVPGYLGGGVELLGHHLQRNIGHTADGGTGRRLGNRLAVHQQDPVQFLRRLLLSSLGLLNFLSSVLILYGIDRLFYGSHRLLCAYAVGNSLDLRGQNHRIAGTHQKNDCQTAQQQRKQFAFQVVVHILVLVAPASNTGEKVHAAQTRTRLLLFVTVL